MLFRLIFPLLLISSLAQADSKIVLAQVNAMVKNGIYHVDAVADVRLPGEVRKALDSGVDLVFTATLRVRHKKKFLPDKTAINLNVRRRLSFHALTKRYTVDDLTFNRRKSFPSLLSALKHLGRYQNVSVLDVSLANPSPMTMMQIRIVLERRELPLPLRLRSYLSRDWYLASDWYEWPLQ